MLTYQSNVARALDQVRIIPFAAGISSLATLIGAFVFIAQLRLGVEGYFIATILGGVCGSLVYEALGKHRDHLLHVGMSDPSRRPEEDDVLRDSSDTQHALLVGKQ